ncbi:MAG: hypothetical protein LBL13_06930 [Bacteroidales bacterium]|jgi:hypothetical protein|nr:hypothetical protein [Bacteroidales bacterium]
MFINLLLQRLNVINQSLQKYNFSLRIIPISPEIILCREKATGSKQQRRAKGRRGEREKGRWQQAASNRQANYKEKDRKAKGNNH